ncbi:MAG: sigma-70 family RNA polymerase sigma factor [Oscillospiraceae bacterium]|nr:sigma-70 family RNA polymerase sigma factor [Oscillospiraceae bacterium]
MVFETVSSILLQGLYFCLRLTGRGGSFPRPLPVEEEEEALALLAQGDARAREKLILHNLRLVPHVIKKYYTNAADQDDLISIGTVGLVKAIDSYSPDKKAKLPTYACICIQNEIFMHFRGQKKRQGEMSLFEPLENDAEGSPLSVMDVLQTEDNTQERLELEEHCRHVRKAVDNMGEPRMREIIRLRYGLNGQSPLTQRETAARLGISRSYVSRIEKKALQLLGQYIGPRAE